MSGCRAQIAQAGSRHRADEGRYSGSSPPADRELLPKSGTLHDSILFTSNFFVQRHFVRSRFLETVFWSPLFFCLYMENRSCKKLDRAWRRHYLLADKAFKEDVLKISCCYKDTTILLL